MNYCVHCMEPIAADAVVCPHCEKNLQYEVPAHHLLPGTVLNKKFLVGEALGEGGFGITYIGRDLNLDIKVAIKEYFPTGYVNRSGTISADITSATTEDRKAFFDKGRARFLEEARILAKFSGESGIVDVRDFFEENNTAYIIMEYLAGKDLKAHLKANGTLTAEQTVQMLLPVMQALAKIHGQGLIHRDISPDNIRITEKGVKLLDFGAARNVTAIANKSLSVMLKPGYAPEEQYRSKGNQGPWSDVYALCATMYKCITGVTPDDAPERLVNDELKAPSELGIPINKGLERALMKGLSVLQRDRYQSIEELLNGLKGHTTEQTEHCDDDVTVFMGGAVAAAEDELTVAMTEADTQEAAKEEQQTVLSADENEQTVAMTDADADQTVLIEETPQKEPDQTESAEAEVAKAEVAETKPNQVKSAKAEVAESETEEKAPTQKNKRPWAFVLGGAALIAVLLIISPFLFGKRAKQDTQPSFPPLAVPQRQLAYHLEQLGTIEDPERALNMLDDFLYVYEEDQYRMLDCLGEVASEERFSNIVYMTNEVYAVCQSKNGVDRWGLLDSACNVLLPCEATAVQTIYNDNSSRNRYLILSYTADDDAVYCRVYDTVQKDFVPDLQLSDASANSLNTCGDNLLFTDETGTHVLCAPNGAVLFQTAHHTVTDGSVFVVQDDNTYRVYDENGVQTYVSNKFVGTVSGNGGYLYTSHEDGVILMDRNGNRIGDQVVDTVYDEQNGIIRVTDNGYQMLLRADGSLITAKDKYSYIYATAYDFYAAACGENSDGTTQYALFGPEGELALNLPNDGDTLCIMQENTVLVLNDRSFALELETDYPTVLRPALIAAQAENTALYGLFDLFTGEQLLGYEYEVIQTVADCVYAYKNGIWTVYDLEMTVQ